MKDEAMELLHPSSSAAPASFVEQVELSRKNHERWLRSSSASIEDTRALCHLLNTEGKSNVECISERLKALDFERKALANEILEKSNLQESLSLLSSRREALEKSIAELLDLQQCQEQQIAEQLEESNGALSERRTKNNFMLDSILWYQKNLGFRVEPTKNNGLWIILTKVTSANLDREFSFSIRHDKQRNLYTMLECNPEVANSEQLVKELNRTNDLIKFIYNMRTGFREQATGHGNSINLRSTHL